MAFYNQMTPAFPQAQLEEESKPAPDFCRAQVRVQMEVPYHCLHI